MIPTDEQALTLIEHAMEGAFSVDEEGTHTLVGADFTLQQLMDFWAGHDPENKKLIGRAGETPVFEMLSPTYTRDDIITALIAEVRKLRGEHHE